MDEEMLEKNEGYYEFRLKEYGEKHWLAPTTWLAPLRFEALYRNLGMENHSSILDVGCGAGWLLTWLFGTSWGGDYIGTDPYARAIEEATEPGYDENIGFWLSDVVGDFRKGGEDWQRAKSRFGGMDYVVMINVFAHRTGSLAFMKRYVLDAIDCCFELCNKGMALTTYSTYKMNVQASEAAFDPCWLYQTGRQLTERVLIDSTFTAHENMLVLFKERSKFRKIWQRAGGWNVESGILNDNEILRKSAQGSRQETQAEDK